MFFLRFGIAAQTINSAFKDLWDEKKMKMSVWAKAEKNHGAAQESIKFISRLGYLEEIHNCPNGIPKERTKSL